MEDISQLVQEALSNIEEKYFRRTERDFAYELYHQMRITWHGFPFEIETTGESKVKHLNGADMIFQHPLINQHFILGETLPSFIRKFPDFLIHEFDTRNHQLVALEIKRTFNPNSILKDLAKLIVYCRGNLSYQKGIFILINPRRNVLEIPNVREMLLEFPEIEIWIARPNTNIEIINSNNINN
jgi:hypothetical protein